jgi:predicted RNase H-like HicB family nuclease
MRRFLVITERANGNYSAYSPDLPGCVATGETREEAEQNMREAVELHLQGLVEDKLPIPESHSFASFIAVP